MKPCGVPRGPGSLRDVLRSHVHNIRTTHDVKQTNKYVLLPPNYFHETKSYLEMLTVVVLFS